MSRRKKTHPSRSRNRRQSEGPALVVVLSILGMTLIGYLAGEMVFALRPHPAHWSVALLGALVGWAIGKTYYRYRGDII